MELFSVDGFLFQFMRRLLDILKLNFCWLICSLPIVTIGPATVAAFSVSLKMVDESEGYVMRQFFKEFKANLKIGFPLGICFLVGLYAIYLDTQLISAGNQGLIKGYVPFVFMAVTIITIYIFISVFIYSFALAARYENTFLRTVKNSHEIFLRHFPKTLAIIFIVAIELVFILWNRVTIYFGILIGPACIIYTISGMALPIFRQIERDGGAVLKEYQKSEEAVFEDHPENDSIAAKAHMNLKSKK
ncbi:MAG: DUF624 domain-containing protein [Lachnospiraceae bacterium]|nr:DUF624 domain-containing protein [Lachnospiraceae bacterium]